MMMILGGNLCKIEQGTRSKHNVKEKRRKWGVADLILMRIITILIISK